MYQPPYLPDTQALTEFREHTASVLKRLKGSRRALLLTQRGKAAGVVMSTRTYEQLAEAAELVRSIEAVRRSIREFREGKAVPADVVLEAMEQAAIRRARRTSK